MTTEQEKISQIWYKKYLSNKKRFGIFDLIKVEEFLFIKKTPQSEKKTHRKGEDIHNTPNQQRTNKKNIFKNQQEKDKKLILK